MRKKNQNLSLDAALENRLESLCAPREYFIEHRRLDETGESHDQRQVTPPPVPAEHLKPPPPPESHTESWVEIFRGPKVPAVEKVLRGVEPGYFPIKIERKTVPYIRIESKKAAVDSGTDQPSTIAVDTSKVARTKQQESENQFHDVSTTASHRIKTSQGEIWVSGSSLLCQCPDCDAPMTIRLWLRLADCWRCPSSIALDEETIEKAAKLLRSKPLPKPPPSPAEFYSRKPLSIVEPNVGRRQPEIAVDPRRSELERLTEGSFLARSLRRGFSMTPAWLVSFILHLIALLILAMIFFGDAAPQREMITLSSFLSADDEEGGDMRFENPLDTMQDDLSLASKMDVSEREAREMIAQAQADAKELRFDPDSVSPLIDVDQLKENLTTRPDQRMSFAARDPRVRAEIVEKAGGTNLTEAAVARGLRWLASVQNDDGSWSLENYAKSGRKGNRGDTMGTALALLPFLGAGQSHEFGVYKQNVAAGLRWLMEMQKANGDLRNDPHSQAGMYAHGQASIVLCEALALTADQQLVDPAQRAIAFIEVAQHKEGGWRYRPGEAGDTSVFGWQMMALQSARSPQMNLYVDDSTLRLCDFFLDKVSSPAKSDGRRLPTGATYCYQPGRPSTASMTAEAILCRMYLGWKKDDPRMIAGVNWLMNEHFPNVKDKNVYYWYYGTQVMHHYGGDQWEKWNSRMRELLVSTQDRRGSAPGSWNPKPFQWGKKGGRIYTTSMAVCTLEVYYRHLPLFNPIDLEAARDF